ncbi:MAG: UbiA family prenyltransferase [Thermoplasmata archaeon]
MTEPPAPGPARELGRYLEIQNLGLNLPFALAFLLLAARGLPTLRVTALIVVAFIAARNAGHSFNRWADREYDRANPRTRTRALATGRYPGGFALGFAAANAILLGVAAALLNPLALLLTPVALLALLGYSYTKRFTALTTPFLGFVEAIAPAAVFVAVRGTLPPAVFLAVGGILLWGTAFETIHSLGDLESDRALGLRSLPLRLGAARSLRLLPALHAAALGLLAAFGLLMETRWPFYIGLAAMAAIALDTDRRLARGTLGGAAAFRRHFLMAGLFLVGAAASLLLPA